jgi:cytoskeletal protein CcmA (bactofilin family)
MWKQEDTKPSSPARNQPGGGAPAPDAQTPVERRVVAWVGKSLVFKGKVMSSEDITIDGRVEGSVEVKDHVLTVGPDANIYADVEARIVTVLGAVTGTIVASEKVEIRESGSVEGDVVSPRLAMADGARLRGRVDDQTSRRNLRSVESRV